MSGWNFDSQQSLAELDALIEHLLPGSRHETSVLEQHDILSDAFRWYFIRSQPLSRFLQGRALAKRPSSGSGHETDQHNDGILVHDIPPFLIPSQDLHQFLQHDAFIEYPSFGSGNETPVEQNGMPNDVLSWLIPAVSLYQFLQPFALPASEPATSGGGHDQNYIPYYAPLFLIPAGSLYQFLQLHEVPPPLPSGSGNETLAEQQPEDGGEDDAMSVSITPTQSQDSGQVDAQPNEATASISNECPVCTRTLGREQERNRHVESHLPHSICCPLPDCFWTGRRRADFNTHWEIKHLDIGQVPVEDANVLYDPRTFVKMILKGTHVDEVARSAYTKVKESLERLGKADTRANVLGRSRDLRMLICAPALIPPSLPD